MTERTNGIFATTLDTSPSFDVVRNQIIRGCAMTALAVSVLLCAGTSLLAYPYFSEGWHIRSAGVTQTGLYLQVESECSLISPSSPAGQKQENLVQWEFAASSHVSTMSEPVPCDPF